MATLTAVQVAAAARLGGFPDAEIPTAVAVARGESSFSTTSSNSCCTGLWQINRSAHADKIAAVGGVSKLTDPVVNASLAHQIWAGNWCGSKTGNGRCTKFEAYGLSNAGKSWAAKLAEGNRAYAELTQQTQAGKTANQILGSASTSTSALVPAQNAAFPGTGTLSNVEHFFGALTDRNTWIRVAEIIIGAMLINVGLQKAAGVDYKKIVSLVATRGGSAAKAAGKAKVS